MSWRIAISSCLFPIFLGFTCVDVFANKSPPTSSDLKVAEKCHYCHVIVNDFQTGFDSTMRDNYGGGNTQWEESRLGAYATSEMRLMQIIERLCHQESTVKSPGTSSDSKTRCHRFVEEIEDSIEQWWLHEWGPSQTKGSPSTKVHDSLYLHLCVEKLMVCCPAGHFGPSCTPCVGRDSETGVLCSSHGHCHGNETRLGDGTCHCDKGYTGPLCRDCAQGYFADGDSCRACHEGCNVKEGCSGPGPGDCRSCASGWTLDSAGASPVCRDIDECNPPSTSKAPLPCSTNPNTFCENLPGTFRCRHCHTACAPGKGCIGPDANHCRACHTPGYQWNTTTMRCDDVDECALHEDVCSVEGQLCRNSQGSFSCECPQGMEVDDDEHKCVSKRPTPSRNSGKKPKKKVPPKIIWTVPYALEFGKLVGVAVVFCLLIQLVAVKALEKYQTLMNVGVLLLSAAFFVFVYKTGLNLERLVAKYG